MKNLKIFGDSIIKGVTYNGQSYHLCQEHDFDTLRAQGVTVENNAKMGATIDAGLKQLDRKLGACDSDTTVLFCFGGNDCDYDWKAISEDPDGEHLPHTPSEQFIDRYCTAIRKAQSAAPRGHDEPAAAGAGAVFYLYHSRPERGEHPALAGRHRSSISLAGIL